MPGAQCPGAEKLRSPRTRFWSASKSIRSPRCRKFADWPGVVHPSAQPEAMLDVGYAVVKIDVCALEPAESLSASL